MRYALIDNATGLVANVVEIDAADGSATPEGFTAVESNIANIGDTWDGTKIIPQPQPAAPDRG